LLVGGVLLFFADVVLLGDWIVAVVAIVIYWLLLPISVNPRVRKRLLPPWDDIKKDLVKQGYTEHNYWRGDWWKVKSKNASK